MILPEQLISTFLSGTLGSIAFLKEKTGFKKLRYETEWVAGTLDLLHINGKMEK